MRSCIQILYHINLPQASHVTSFETRRSLPEQGGISGPFVDIIFERVAMESEKVPPVGGFLSLDIETGGKPCGL